jgi:hypothetical protein
VPHPSAAKAGSDLIGFIGTTEVEPFQSGVLRLRFSACLFKMASPSAAKAGCDLAGFIGTTEVVPFQSGCVFPRALSKRASRIAFSCVPFQNGVSDCVFPQHPTHEGG